MSVRVERAAPIATVILHRPEVRNAVDRATAEALAAAFRALDADPTIAAIVLWGEGGTFCAGADLGAFARGEGNRLSPEGDAPMGPTRLVLSKPVIAAIAGYAVAGGLELACWCDLRVVERTATFGVFCRRFGVPLIDGGTARLPRLIGLSRALDLILTGRAVSAEEAFTIGLANRLVEPGASRAAAEALAHQLAALPPTCLRGDLAAARAAFDHPLPEALTTEFAGGLLTIASGETAAGATRFTTGAGRHGAS
jgi:enoyl-CoA hydratase